MSIVEEDVELRDLLAQTLEKSGCLAKLRAELRANIFLALDEDEQLSKQQPLQNHKVRSYLQTSEGQTMFYLVREFLEFFNLQFTISVFEPESYLDNLGQYKGREKLAENLGLKNESYEEVPLLQHLLKIAQAKLDINLNVNDSSLKDEPMDSSYKKTDETVNSSSSNDSQQSKQFNSTFDVNSPTVGLNNTKDFMKIVNNSSNESQQSKQFNATFDVNSPTFALNNTKDFLKNISNSSNESKPSIQFNETFDVNSPTVTLNNGKADFMEIIEEEEIVEEPILITDSPTVKIFPNKLKDIGEVDETIEESILIMDKTVPVPKILKDIREDDTYEDTSSIAEDSELQEVPSYNPSSEKSSNKPKNNNLSSLTNLPPLKSKINNAFKNNKSLKELDHMFDMDAEYEEDFMSEEQNTKSGLDVSMNN